MRLSFVLAGLCSGLIIVGVGMYMLGRPSSATPATSLSSAVASMGAKGQDYFAPHSSSETSQPDTISQRVDNPWVDDLVARAQVLPPGLEADVLLRLAAALPPTEADRSHRLLDRADAAAARAQRHLPGRAMLTYLNDETVDPLRLPTTAGLDTMNLLLRSAKERGLQGAALAAAWQTLPLPAAATCDTKYADDPQPAFDVMTAQGDDDVNAMIQRWTARMAVATHESEANAAMHVLTSVPADDVPRMTPDLIALLDRARHDDAVFSQTSIGMANDLPLVTARLTSAPDLQKQLNEAFARYVADHFAAQRCPSSVKGEHWLLEQRAVNGVKNPQNYVDTTFPALDAVDTQAAELSKAAFTVRKALAEKQMSQDQSIDIQRPIAAFLDQADAALAHTDDKDAEARIPRTVLHELELMLDAMPAGPLRARAFQLAQRAIDDPSMQNDDDQWWGESLGLLRDVATWPDSLQRMAALAQDSDLRMAIYAQLAQRGLLKQP